MVAALALGACQITSPPAVPTADQRVGEALTDPAASTEPSVSAKPAAALVRTVTERKAIPFSTRTVKDGALAKGKTVVRTKGVAGVRTVTYEVTYTGGKETKRRQTGDQVTRSPVTKVVAVGTKAASGGGCDENYTPCVPVASDVDCAGGSGNGPAYVDGPVQVVGTDVYDLDRDGDGIACDT